MGFRCSSGFDCKFVKINHLKARPMRLFHRIARKLIVLAVFIPSGLSTVDAAGDELQCLTDREQVAANLYRQLQQQAYAALDRRNEVYEDLKTVNDIEAYQARLREFFTTQLGGFPERTPLNAQTVRTIEADGYSVENVIFESQPRHHVTANFYLPAGEGPFPCVVVSSGHSRTGKTAGYNQRFGLMMARHGMAALCFDPIGQGERSQILNDQGEPRFGSTTTEHFLIGTGSILVGRNTARYRVWDAIRAIDYVTGRPEIDGTKIGYTGCSGGGTLTSYVMALDDRVTCAAPACYLTTFRRLIETIGPQDAEQNIFGQVAYGMDQPDYILMRAPRPTLISSTTNDFFDIDGAWSNYRQAKRIYARLGYPERVDLVEVEGNHGVQPQNLATIAHWMQRWLLDRDEPVAIADLPTRPERDLWCTETGQVMQLPSERSVFDLNAEYAGELAKQRAAQVGDDAALRARIAEVIGMRPLDQQKPPTWKDKGRVSRGDHHIDKLVMTTDSGTLLPALTFHPAAPVDAAYLYLHDDGKLGDSQDGGPIEQLVDDNFAVVSVDLRGQGETASGERNELLGDWKTYYLSYLLGKPLVGPRVEDTLAAAHFVAYYQKAKDDPREVHVVGVGQAGIVALHAAAMRPDLFTSVTLRDVPSDWTSLLAQDVPAGQLDSTAHGALAVYDLPDLVRLVGKDKVIFAANDE